MNFTAYVVKSSREDGSIHWQIRMTDTPITRMLGTFYTDHLHDLTSCKSVEELIPKVTTLGGWDQDMVKMVLGFYPRLDEVLKAVSESLSRNSFTFEVEYFTPEDLACYLDDLPEWGTEDVQVLCYDFSRGYSNISVGFSYPTIHTKNVTQNALLKAFYEGTSTKEQVLDAYQATLQEWWKTAPVEVFRTYWEAGLTSPVGKQVTGWNLNLLSHSEIAKELRRRKTLGELWVECEPMLAKLGAGISTPSVELTLDKPFLVSGRQDSDSEVTPLNSYDTRIEAEALVYALDATGWKDLSITAREQKATLPENL